MVVNVQRALTAWPCSVSLTRRINGEGDKRDKHDTFQFCTFTYAMLIAMKSC